MVTSTPDPCPQGRRKLLVFVAVRDSQLRDACGRAAARDPGLRLLAVSKDVAEPRMRGECPDVIVVGAGERSAAGVTAVAMARQLYPEAVVLPVTRDDEPSRILGLAAATTVETSCSDQPRPSVIGVDVIRSAIAWGEPSVVFQPVVDLQDRRVAGVEALARFGVEPSHPPDVWFAAAHGVGLGIDLERAAIQAAIRAATTLAPDVYLAVNVSPAAVLMPDVRAALAEAPPNQLVLEITEHARVDDYDELQAALAPLRARGVRIAIDDVGAGFASLRHVLRLDPEIIKLDQEITRGVEHNAGRAKLVGGLIAGASAVSTLVIAEGIETGPQLRCLRELGVRGGQGYFIGRPSDLRSAVGGNHAVMAALEPGHPPTPSPSGPRQALSGARILVVDDSPAHRHLIRSIFELEGASVHDAATAAAAHLAFEDVEPDLVLLDVRLPDGTGFDVLERIRRTSDTPALFVTAATAVSDRVAGFDRGADDYLLKPFSPEELVARVDSALRRRLTRSTDPPGALRSAESSTC
ncbi:MAG: diguanylate phosphodiesterase [Acidimicrobiales bacterium]|nr:diguanylate phosphodiesterase [Acidimicrobiales bacterium]